MSDVQIAVISDDPKSLNRIGSIISKFDCIRWSFELENFENIVSSNILMVIIEFNPKNHHHAIETLRFLNQAYPSLPKVGFFDNTYQEDILNAYVNGIQHILTPQSTTSDFHCIFTKMRKIFEQHPLLKRVKAPDGLGYLQNLICAWKKFLTNHPKDCSLKKVSTYALSTC